MLHGWRIGLITTVLVIIFAVALAGCISEKASVASLPAADSSAPGIYEFEIGNSLYPLSRGASIGFQRYLNGGEEVAGSLEWRESYAIRYKWSLYVYYPDGSIVLSWNGADMKHNFSFTPVADGTYKIELLKRDLDARRVRLTIDPPDWDRWGR
jgi:hypothetical protein